MSKHLRIYIDKLRNLPPLQADPYVRLKVGAFPSQSPVGTFLSDGEYDIGTTVVFDEAAGQDMSLEVVSSQTEDVVASLTIPNWRQILKGDRFKGLVKLRPEGLVRLDFRLFDSATNFPNRLDCQLVCAIGLPETVKCAVVKIGLGNRESLSKVADSRKSVDGHFEWNERHTAVYNGERACYLQVLDENNTLVGACCYDLWEVLNKNKGNRRRAGKIALADTHGFTVGHVLVGFELWDTQDARSKIEDNLEGLRNLKECRDDNMKLLQVCRQTVSQSDARPILEAQKYLDRASEAIDQAEQVSHQFDDPNIHKSDLAGIRSKLRKSMADAEKMFEMAARYLQQICHSAAARELEIAKVSKGVIDAAARDMLSARASGEKNAEIETLNTDIAEPLIQDANHQEEVLMENITTIQHTLYTPDMLRSYQEVRLARKRLQELAEKAHQLDIQISDNVRARRLAVRRQECIRQTALGISGPVLMRSARETPIFPICCCCWL